MAKFACPSCGYRNPPHQEFCEKCGAVFSDNVTQPISKHSTSTKTAQTDLSSASTWQAGKPVYYIGVATIGKKIVEVATIVLLASVVMIAVLIALALTSFIGLVILPLAGSLLFLIRDFDLYIGNQDQGSLLF